MGVMDQYLALFMASASSWLNSMEIQAMRGDSFFLQLIGKWAYTVYHERELVLMYTHMLLSALFPIYVGSHATLRCPPSASKTTKRKISDDDDDDDDDDEDSYEAEIDEFRGQGLTEGLTPSDAAVFPVIASLVLGGFYLLIKWLNDLTLLNKILGYYFSMIGIVGVGNLAGDALNVITTFIFPSVWSAHDKLYFVDPLLSEQFTIGPMVQGPNKDTLQRNSAGKNTPLPGLLSKINFPEKISHLLWAARALFRNHWIFRGWIRGLMTVKRKVRLNNVIGPMIGVAIVALYNISGRHWSVANLMGFGFCYGSIQLISPTTFWTGTLMLSGLFVYDIVMVFYTPLMVTVATSLKVPVVLVFPGPQKGSMLGLGDIILPGMMIAFALRFDLYLHYLRKPAPLSISHSLTASTSSKPSYEPASGRWGERYWTSNLPASQIPSDVAATSFPKVYFTASLVGYYIGMVVTLAVLNIYHRGQPALLYLVPSVLGALWGTALCRGELKLMWEYTEAEDEGGSSKIDVSKRDEADRDIKSGGDGSKEFQNGSIKGDLESSATGEVKGSAEKGAKKEEKKPFRRGRDLNVHLSYFMLSEPRRRSKSEATLEDESSS